MTELSAPITVIVVSGVSKAKAEKPDSLPLRWKMVLVDSGHLTEFLETGADFFRV